MAQVYFAEIRSYQLNIGRSSPGSGDFGHSWQRYIKLNLNPGRFGDGVTTAELNFFEDPTHIPNYENGVRSSRGIKILIPLNDFRDLYDVLRSEKPLSFLWQQMESGSATTRINSWRLTTSSEPLAEGDSEL